MSVISQLLQVLEETMTASLGDDGHSAAVDGRDAAGRRSGAVGREDGVQPLDPFAATMRSSERHDIGRRSEVTEIQRGRSYRRPTAGHEPVSRDRHAPRTIVIVAPSQPNRDRSRSGDAVLTLIAAAQRLTGVNVVVVQPGNSVAINEIIRPGHAERRIDIQVSNPDQMRDQIRTVISGERLTATVNALPPTVSFVVVGPSTRIGKDGLRAIDDALALEPQQFEHTTVVFEADYHTVTDTNELSSARKNSSGPLHPLEEASYTPADARALTEGSWILSNAKNRVARQATERLRRGDIDLTTVPILRGSGLEQDASPQQILDVVTSRSLMVTPVSAKVATRLRTVGADGLMPDEMSQLNDAGNALLKAAGLGDALKPIEPSIDSAFIPVHSEFAVQSDFTLGA